MARKELIAPQYPIVSADPFQESLDNLLVVAFPRSNSSNFPVALAIAQGAAKFGVLDFGGRSLFLAVFARAAAEAGRAKALISYAASWKGTLLFASGKLMSDSYRVLEVLNCYLEACSCNDTRAHCHSIIDDPHSTIERRYGASITIRLVERPTYKEEVHIDRYSFPCRHLQPWFRLEKDHPSSPRDQIQAAGVLRGCIVCPLFDPSEYKVVGTKTVIREHPT